MRVADGSSERGRGVMSEPAPTSDCVQVGELPDGGHEFVLDDPVLRSLTVDGRVTLRLGRIDVVVGGPCSLEVDGVCYQLDPSTPETPTPLLSCFPGTARWVWSSPDGRLTLDSMQGQRLVVSGTVVPTAWSVGGGRT